MKAGALRSKRAWPTNWAVQATAATPTTTGLGTMRPKTAHPMANGTRTAAYGVGSMFPKPINQLKNMYQKKKFMEMGQYKLVI